MKAECHAVARSRWDESLPQSRDWNLPHQGSGALDGIVLQLGLGIRW
jgi:hypothetical protein